MRAGRRLVLRREVLTELKADDLARVAGAGELLTTPIGGCVTDVLSRLVVCDSLFQPCVSNTCTR